MLKKLRKNNHQKIVCIIQARMNSDRLPGKVLKPILRKPILWYIIDSVKRSKTVDEIVVATTKNKKDDRIASLAKKMNISIFRGNEKDVLKRYYDAARKYEADYIVRVCGDCPLIDWKILDDVVKSSLRFKKDYTSNNLPKTYPFGYDVEVVTLKTLSKAHLSTKDKDDREHVTLFIERKPNLFSHHILHAPSRYKKPHWRLSVDTKEDFILINKIISKLYVKNSSISIDKVFNFINKNPKLLKINSHIKPKVVHGIV